MRRFIIPALLAAFSAGFVQATASATTSASATYRSQQLGLNSYQYNFTLQNTGTTPIGTFWFSWIPGYDLLPTTPSSVSSPIGWTGGPMSEGIGSSSVMWNAATLLQPGESISGFAFNSSDSPSTLAGTSAFFGLPVDESYVYSGPNETGTFGALVAAPAAATPEPAALATIVIAAGLFLRSRRVA